MLLDREAELSLAAAALRGAQAGRGTLMLVCGPLGIGKSALLDAMGERGARMGAVVLRASAAPMERDFSFGVVRQLLEPALRRASSETVARWTAGAARHARPVLADDAFGAGEPQPTADSDDAALHGLAALVENMACDQPLLVLVDDLQWADAATLRWLRHIANRLAAARILLVCALREGDMLAEQQSVRDVTAHATHTLHPKLFGLDASRAMIRRNCAEPADEEFVAACHRAGGGNPVFLASILAEVAARGLKPLAANAAAAADLRPPLLRQRLLLCLESQSDQVRLTARALAVLGDEAQPEILGRLCELDAVGRDEALRVLLGLGLLTDPYRPRFVHPVVQDAVEEGMPMAERATMHALAAELLHRAGLPAEQVADQLLAITAPQGGWATQVLRTAADNALRHGEPETSARYLRRALLDSSPHGADRGRLLVDLATSERSFAPAAAVRHIAQAVPLLDSPVERAEAVARLAPAVLASTLLPVHDMLRQVVDGLGDEQGLEGQERELALHLEARVRHTAVSDPVELADSLVRLKTLGPDPAMDTAGERDLLTVLLRAATCAGALPAAEVADLSNRILEREPAFPAHVHTALPMLVTNLVAADSVHALGPWLDMAFQNAERTHTRVERAIIRTEQSLFSLACGRLADARDRAVEAFDLAGTERDEVITVSAVALTAVAIQSRDAPLAERLLGDRFRAAREPYLWALLTLLKGTVLARDGDLRTALDHIHDAGHRLEQSEWSNPFLLPWASSAALVHHRLGNRERAASLSLQEVERARAWGAPATLGRALAVQGRVTEGPPGLVLLQDAVDVLEASANRFELCQALLALGQRLGPEVLEGEAALRRSYTLAHECGAPWLARRAGARLGDAAPAPAPVRGQLTPAERNVAELAVSGLTNQAIADDLGITCRAVEKHLTNCYRKMSIKGRSVLATALRELG